MTSFPTIRFTILTSLAALLCMYPAIASAGLSGEASLNYTDYAVSDDLNNHLSTHSLTQEYSLLYSSRGPVYNSRLGKYDVSLGYNWSALDTHTSTTSGDDDSKVSRGHILYSGEILLDPKEVPLRLAAYSRDLNRNSFSTSESAATSSFFSKTGGRFLQDPNIATDINSGIHNSSGATLVAGVKNGMTNGYNEVLRHFPMIMLDYRDQVDRDLRSQAPVDTRLSRLAFVSLNKKDNWFHYRYVTFNDYINPSNDYEETQIQLGTIDQTQARKWIDFANWLQVSADMQLTKHTSNTSSSNFEDIDLNLFSQARQSNWEARTFNNFNRNRLDDGTLTYSTTLPLYVSGSLNPDFNWSTRAMYRDVNNNNGAFLENAVAGYRVNTFMHSPFTLSHNFDFESSRSENADMYVLSGGLETTSTPRFSRLYSLAASYNIKNSAQNNNTSGRSDFLEQRLSLSASYAPSNYVRVMLRQANEFTNGANQRFESSAQNAATTLPQYVAPRVGNVDMAGSGAHSFHSLTSLMTTWNPLARLNFSLIASEDLYSASDNGSSNITSVSASVDYSNAKIKLSDSLNYTNGSYLLGVETTTLSNVATLNYAHNRSLDSRISVAYYRQVDQSVVSYSFSAEQQVNYRFFSSAGMARNLLEISEKVAYSNSPYQNSISNFIINTNNATTAFINNPRAERGAATLGFKYYPLRQLVFSNGANYQYENTFKNYSLLWYSSLGVNFPIFQASLDYYQGKRQSDGLLEKKFTASLKKQF